MSSADRPTSGGMYFRLLFAALALSGCVARGELSFSTVEAPGSVFRQVHVVTSREPVVPGYFGIERAFEPTFARYEVSIPANHVVGQVDLPRSSVDADPHLHFVTREWSAYRTNSAWEAGVRQEMLALPRGQRELVIFVHGFNNTFAEGLYRAAQLAEDYRLTGVMAHFSWPSAANPLTYAYDRDSVLFSRDSFAQMLDSATRVGAERVLVVAHSMGSLLTMEALSLISKQRPGWVARNISAVVLMSPDIDPDIFQTQARGLGSFPQEFIVFSSQKDRALALSARLTGQNERLGNVQDIEGISEFPITFIDTTSLSKGSGHTTALDSPALISLLTQSREVNASLDEARANRTGLLPGTVLTVQNATEIILAPGGRVR